MTIAVGTDWIETFTGKQFHLLNPSPDEICIEDIAHALAHQCRFTGHTRKFYSVAEHSFHVSRITGTLEGLLHDASEAYITDLSRPVKYNTPVGIPYFEVENAIMSVIAKKFGFVWPVAAAVKSADNIMLHTEKVQLMTDLSWDGAWGQPELSDVRLECWTPELAELVFLQRFDELTKA